MTNDELLARAAEIELCSELEALKLIETGIGELWDALAADILRELVKIRRKQLEKPRFSAFEEAGMAVANLNSIKKLEIKSHEVEQKGDELHARIQAQVNEPIDYVSLKFPVIKQF